jgi:hypothetical protein
MLRQSHQRAHGKQQKNSASDERGLDLTVAGIAMTA